MPQATRLLESLQPLSNRSQGFPPPAVYRKVHRLKCMLKLVAYRLLLAVPLLFVVTFLTFFLNSLNLHF